MLAPDTRQRLLALIDSVSNDRVLFIGEAITDVYCFVSPLAKPSKENILAVRHDRSERYDGGVTAAHAHAVSFYRAGLLTQRTDRRDAPIRKTRYLEGDYSRKLFEVQALGHVEALEVSSVEPSDVLAVADFGHGMITAEVAEALGRAPAFLAVAAQTNAANHGFNLITKYPRADYVVIDEPEARLAAADRDGPLEGVIRRLAAGRAGGPPRCSKFVVTHGRHGAYGWDGERLHHRPAVSDSVVDTMGAGDAFFAVTAAMARHGSVEDLLEIGNAAAALKCRVLGHREPVTKRALVEFLGAL